jgi:hypothetical protein
LKLTAQKLSTIAPWLARNIHSSLGSSGSSEEYALLQNKLAVVRFDTGELLGHGSSTSPGNSILAMQRARCSQS